MPKVMPKIAILTPTRGTLFSKMMVSVLREMSMCNQYPAWFITDNMPIPKCRTALVEDALKHKAEFTHFLLVDDDVIIPEGGLGEMLSADTDIAFIDYPLHQDRGKYAGMGTACYDNCPEGTEYAKAKKKPVMWAGLGCVLVKREVFEKLKSPWFKPYHRQYVRDEKGKITWQGSPNIKEPTGEDCYFFLQAQKKGLKVKQMTGFTCGHARIDKLVMHMANEKYTQQHKIKVNDKITQPYSYEVL